MQCSAVVTVRYLVSVFVAGKMAESVVSFHSVGFRVNYVLIFTTIFICSLQLINNFSSASANLQTLQQSPALSSSTASSIVESSKSKPVVVVVRHFFCILYRSSGDLLGILPELEETCHYLYC